MVLGAEADKQNEILLQKETLQRKLQQLAELIDQSVNVRIDGISIPLGSYVLHSLYQDILKYDIDFDYGFALSEINMAIAAHEQWLTASPDDQEHMAVDRKEVLVRRIFGERISSQINYAMLLYIISEVERSIGEHVAFARHTGTLSLRVFAPDFSLSLTEILPPIILKAFLFLLQDLTEAILTNENRPPTDRAYFQTSLDQNQ